MEQQKKITELEVKTQKIEELEARLDSFEKSQAEDDEIEKDAKAFDREDPELAMKMDAVMDIAIAEMRKKTKTLFKESRKK